MVWIATDQGVQEVRYAYTGAWRSPDVEQPLNLQEQQSLINQLQQQYAEYYATIDEYDIKAAERGKTELPAWYPTWIDYLVPGGPVLKILTGSTGGPLWGIDTGGDLPIPVLFPEDYGSGVIPGLPEQPVPQVGGQDGINITWPDLNLDDTLKGLGESATKFGAMALVGLGLVAVIMFLK